MGKRYVFGLGTGRCGTVSLARLLSAQDDTEVSHEELEYNLAYQGGEGLIRAYIGELARRRASVVGDVFSAFLPYCRQIAETCADVRFICIKRDRQGTIDSFIRKVESANHWIEHDGSRWMSDPWDRCFPKYSEPTRESAIGRYWDDYYEEAERLSDDLGERFAIFPVEHLNTKSGQTELLEFAGFEDIRFTEVWENRG